MFNDDFFEDIIEKNEYILNINRVKILRFASKYKNIRKCFTSHEETDELYDFLFDLSKEFDISEDNMYYIFMISKYDQYGDIAISFISNFTTQLTLFITDNK